MPITPLCQFSLNTTVDLRADHHLVIIYHTQSLVGNLQIVPLRSVLRMLIMSAFFFGIIFVAGYQKFNRVFGIINTTGGIDARA
jgi:hypothetical protein